MKRTKIRIFLKIFREFGEVIVIIFIAILLFIISQLMQINNMSNKISDVFLNFSINLFAVQILLKIFAIKTTNAQKKISTFERLQKEIDFLTREDKDKKDYLIHIMQQLNNIKMTEVDLSAIDLSGKRISKLDLSKSEIQNATLNDCIFSQVDLEDTDFSNSNLFQANFDNCNLKNAKFCSCNLNYSSFSNMPTLYKTDFDRADLVGASFKGIEFNEVSFRDTSLNKTVFEECIFKKIDFTVVKDYRLVQSYKNCKYVKCKGIDNT